MDWVALLRAVNVGGRNRVPMAELRCVLERAGCGAVRTYIQSGNAVFTSDVTDRAELVALLERAVLVAFDVPAAVVVRSAAELAAIVRSHPFGDDTSATYVTFLAARPGKAAIARLAALDLAPDEAKVVGSDVFVRYPNRMTGAKLTGALLERQLAIRGTARNWRTVARLAELAQS